jgi:xanthine dehydrogenase YagR molybdenum-binding subunit
MSYDTSVNEGHRVEGRDKVTGAARYAFEYPVPDAVYAYPLQAPIACGQIGALDAAEALAMPGVIAVLWGGNTQPFGETAFELALFHRSEVTYRGQLVGAVIADTLENARAAAAAVHVDYEQAEHDVTLRADHPGLYRPDKINPDFPTDFGYGDVAAGLAEAVSADPASTGTGPSTTGSSTTGPSTTGPATTGARIAVTYTTPVQHNNPMEPHAAIASWDSAANHGAANHGAGSVTIYDSTQGASADRATIAAALGLDLSQVRVVSPHVGGGFGSKGTTRPPAIIAAVAARAVGRPVKVALTRQQMFALTGHRTPTIQHLELAATADGRLTALAHDVIEHTATRTEFAEQTATCTRVMYRTPALRTTHRLARLNVPAPSWMRAPGETPGMYALESAMDELADALGMDPVELRVVNDPATEPESGLPFSSRNLVACLREGAERFGWAGRDPRPGVRRRGRWLTGTGVAASTYPARRRPSTAVAEAVDGGYEVRIAAADIGTGARTALGDIAASVLGVDPGRVRVVLGDSDLPSAPLAGGSMGTASWGSAVAAACEALRKDGVRGTADTTDDVAQDGAWARHSFGAQFAEVLVNPLTGEIRVPRLLGVFAAGRIVNPVLARSQFIGGMTMGLSMALFEATAVDAAAGGFVRTDLAQYHVASCADVPNVEAFWIEEDDPHLWPGGGKGIGEIGITGTAAAIGNAVYHATGRRVRDLPITPAKLLGPP